MILAIGMAATAQDVGRFRFTLAVSTAILTSRLGGAMTTRMRALVWLVHDLVSPAR
jgi:hypothetical protein